MSRWTILLRLLLSLAVLFNGTTLNGTTAAMAFKHRGHDAMPALAAPAPATSAADALPCPGHDQAASMASEGPAAPVPAKSGHPSLDCCQSGACQCACVHPAPAAVPAIAFAAVSIGHARSARPMPTSHAAPALPDLIRPPIG
jgi:hypothetical protein